MNEFMKMDNRIDNRMDERVDDRLVLPAKEFLKVYFSDHKERSTSDFDIDIIGGFDYQFMCGPRWNKTPFFRALSELVDEEVIHFKIDDFGGYVYWMPKIINKLK